MPPKWRGPSSSFLATFIETYYILLNLIVRPAIKFLTFVCVSIQVVVSLCALYKTTSARVLASVEAESWSEIYEFSGFVAIYYTKILELAVCAVLLATLVETAQTVFVEKPETQPMTVFKGMGFHSTVMGMGTFYLICSNINDERGLKFLTENLLSKTTMSSLGNQIDFVLWARYITCIMGVLFIVSSVLLKFRRFFVCFASDRDSEEEEPTEEEIAEEKMNYWRNLPTCFEKTLTLLYYMILMTLPLISLSLQIIYLHHELKDSSACSGDIPTSDCPLYLDQGAWGTLLYAVPDSLLAVVIISKFSYQFWYKPFTSTRNIVVLLYLYLIFNMYSKSEKYLDFFVREGWTDSTIKVQESLLIVVMVYVGLPVAAWFIISLVTKTSSYFFWSCLKRIYKPFTGLLKNFVAKPEQRYASIYTLAVLCGIAGALSTLLSPAYELMRIEIKPFSNKSSIIADFYAIEDTMIKVSNGFVIVAANVNPCMDYTKASGGSNSVESLIEAELKKQNYKTTDLSTIMKTFYDQSDNDNFKKRCFKKDGDTMIYSGYNATDLCENVKEVSEASKALKEKEKAMKAELQPPPNCTSSDVCLKNSDKEFENELTTNTACEKGICGGFIAGVVAAFALSFVPFGGPLAAKTMQISLRVVRGVQKFAKIFKKVVKSIRSQKKTISRLYELFKELLSLEKLVVSSNYQLFCFLAASILLGVVAFGIGFFKRMPNLGSRPILGSLFTTLLAVCGILTWLTFTFDTVLTEFFTAMFGKFSFITIETAVGLQMMKWGYFLSTASSLLFIVAVFLSYFANGPEDKISKKLAQRRSGGNINVSYKFSRWLAAFIITVPVYYLAYIAYIEEYRLVEVQLRPSRALDEIRRSFSQTSILKGDLGDADEAVKGEGSCDFVSKMVKEVVFNLPVSMPDFSSINQLFGINSKLLVQVKRAIDKVTEVFDFQIGGFHLLTGVNFPTIQLKFELWQTVLIFVVPLFVSTGTLLCLLFSLIQQIGFLKDNILFGQIAIPFFQRSVAMISIESILVQLSMVVLFSFTNGFETPMFSLTMGVGKLVLYGILASVLCLVASIFLFLGQYAPIANESDGYPLEDAPWDEGEFDMGHDGAYNEDDREIEDFDDIDLPEPFFDETDEYSIPMNSFDTSYDFMDLHSEMNPGYHSRDTVHTADTVRVSNAVQNANTTRIREFMSSQVPQCRSKWVRVASKSGVNIGKNLHMLISGQKLILLEHAPENGHVGIFDTETGPNELGHLISNVRERLRNLGNPPINVIYLLGCMVSPEFALALAKEAGVQVNILPPVTEAGFRLVTRLIYRCQTTDFIYGPVRDGYCPYCPTNNPRDLCCYPFNGENMQPKYVEIQRHGNIANFLDQHVNQVYSSP